jgi:hypothetical protein
LLIPEPFKYANENGPGVKVNPGPLIALSRGFPLSFISPRAPPQI